MYGILAVIGAIVFIGAGIADSTRDHAYNEVEEHHRKIFDDEYEVYMFHDKLRKIYDEFNVTEDDFIDYLIEEYPDRDPNLMPALAMEALGSFECGRKGIPNPRGLKPFFGILPCILFTGFLYRDKPSTDEEFERIYEENDKELEKICGKKNWEKICGKKRR